MKNGSIMGINSIELSPKSKFMIRYKRDGSTNYRTIRNDYNALLTRYNTFKTVTKTDIPPGYTFIQIISHLLTFRINDDSDKKGGSIFLNYNKCCDDYNSACCW